MTPLQYPSQRCFFNRQPHKSKPQRHQMYKKRVPFPKKPKRRRNILNKFDKYQQSQHLGKTVSYKVKYKTELCKNMQLEGYCKFGKKCSFAHNKEELRQKIHLHEKFKTKPCKSYHLHGYCSYGIRCSYLHDEYILDSKKNFVYNPRNTFLLFPDKQLSY